MKILKEDLTSRFACLMPVHACMLLPVGCYRPEFCSGNLCNLGCIGKRLALDLHVAAIVLRGSM